jgi:uracil-DNA glycosylase
MLTNITSLEVPCGWKDLIREESSKNYFRSLISFIQQEREAGKIIYPRDEEILQALLLTPLETVKVVILGQDPYHGPNQAHGLSFSVKPGGKFPPSLTNIFKELEDDMGILKPANGYLRSWADEGVLLLNAVLTVESGKPQSHKNLGWEIFTDKIIETINNSLHGVIYLLWGADAKKKLTMIDSSKHFILHASHPSPLSAYRGFLGCKHFSKTNDILRKNGRKAVNWGIIN